MRMHAKEYKVNPDKAAIFGGSSGGQHRTYAGFTGDSELIPSYENFSAG
jgi:hypothetical protein